jgi:hypothetical protein
MKQSTLMRLIPAVVLSLVVPIPALYAAPKPANSSNALREFVRQTAARQAYGLYIMNQKAGWMTTETKLSTIREGNRVRPVAVQTSDTLIRMHVPGAAAAQTTMSMHETTIFALNGDGPILEATEKMLEGGRTTLHKLRRVSGGYVLESQSAGRTIRQNVGQPRETLEQGRRLWKWLLSKPQKGALFSTFTTSLEEENRDTVVQFHYLGGRTMAWGGVPTPVHKVRMKMGGADFEAEVKSDGTPLTGKMGGLFEIRAEEEKMARQLNGRGVNMLAASSIEVDERLGPPQKVQSLTLEVSGLGDFRLPQSHRQQLKKEGGRTLLVLKADSIAARPEVLSNQQRQKYLRATSTLQARDNALRKLSKQIVGAETDPLKKAAKLQSWVYRNLRKTMAANSSTALEVLSSRAGDCTEHSLLFTALARAAGLPSREVGGLMYVDGGWFSKGIFGWHAWSEIYDGKRWISIDPTWNEVWVDATHIKFSEGSEDLAWMNVLGRLQVKVVDFKTKA